MRPSLITKSAVVAIQPIIGPEDDNEKNAIGIESPSSLNAHPAQLDSGERCNF
jgi:hypothetical protein